MRLALCCLVVFALLAAGCSGAPKTVTGPRIVTAAHATNATPPAPACRGFGGTTALVGVGAQLDDSYAVAPFDAIANLEVPANTTAILLDLWWSEGATTGLRSVVDGPGIHLVSDARSSASADDPVRMRFDHPAAGDWTWRAVADPAAVGVVVHFREGLYYEDPGTELLCNS